MTLSRNNPHVIYEFNMLDISYDQTQNFKDYWGTKQIGMFNMYHESFCIHAYNLINWFGGPTEDIREVYQAIVDQILTLGPNRTEKIGKKISINERNALYNW